MGGLLMNSGYVVGLTGGIGCGKTTISNEFKRLGITIIDADEIARDVVAPGSEGLEAIIKQFGPEIVQSDGYLNRAKLRSIVFAKPEKTQWLNDLLHPKIRAQMLAELSASVSSYTILSVPLLLENGMQTLCNRILVVDILPEQQLQRVLARDQSEPATIKKIMTAQIDRKKRLSLADDIIDNSGQPSESMEQVQKLHQTYTKLTKNV
ncbi:MAG: Dephospho-CoA kinase [Glaciecola sp. HTCC2999]|jgi:dephospho-CoA kinase|nr:MAG: Dephospho-CoA kinase [Glaciecola sp. HTCC2999]